MQHLPPGLTVVALCQGAVPALAAAAVLAASHDARAPKDLVLIAAPIDPLANPTRVVRLLRSHSLSWMEEALTEPVPNEFAGRGRHVYPARLQLFALQKYLARRFAECSELFRKVFADDGSDPDRFPFLDAYMSIMDLDARFFLDNTRSLYQDCDLRVGALRVRRQPGRPALHPPYPSHDDRGRVGRYRGPRADQRRASSMHLVAGSISPPHYHSEVRPFLAVSRRAMAARSVARASCVLGYLSSFDYRIRTMMASAQPDDQQRRHHVQLSRRVPSGATVTCEPSDFPSQVSIVESQVVS